MSSIKIQRAFLRTFTSEAEAALTEIADKFGVKISYKSGSFARDGSNATIKFEIVAPDAKTGGFVSREAQDFKRFATQYGFKPEDLGSTFKVRREEFRITGLKTRRPKFPISAERVKDGKKFKFPADAVRRSGQPKFTEGLTDEIKTAFVDLAGRLSPENLSCDGELTATEIRSRRDSIMREWSELERRAGRSVDETESWGFSV